MNSKNDFYKYMGVKDDTAEMISRMIFDDNLMDNSLLRRMMNDEPVNKNPLTIKSDFEMRVYYLGGVFFETIDDVMGYCMNNNLSTSGLEIFDYYRYFAGRTDVISKTSSEGINFYCAIDENGYVTYNTKRSIYCGRFVWEHNYGDISNIYSVFRNRGIVFENDFYDKIEQDAGNNLKKK